MASVFFLSHCGNQDNAVTTIDWGGVECIAGVYEGEGDIRWNKYPYYYLFLSSDQDLVVSIAFQGDSALVKVKGEDGDQLCTHYKGLEVTKVKAINEDVSFVFLISATKVAHSRIEGTAGRSWKLAQGLLDIQVNLTNEDAPCSFKIGSQTPIPLFVGDGKDEDSIESSQLTRQANQADYNVLIEECGGIDTFIDSDMLERKINR